MSDNPAARVGTEAWSWCDERPVPATVVVEQAFKDFGDGRTIYLEVGRDGVEVGVWLTREAWAAMHAAGCRADDDAGARQEVW